MKLIPFLTLLCSTAAHAAGDGTVPVPNQIRESAAVLTVSGEPGAGQDNQFKYVQLKTDSKGRIVKAILGGDSTTPSDDIWETAELGREVSLPPGKYFLNYYSSAVVVDLASGDHKQINLAKLNVPKVDGSYSFSVFLDFTQKSAQDLMMIASWVQSQGTIETTTDSFCDHHHWNQVWGCHTDSYDTFIPLDELCTARNLRPKAAKYCAAWKSGNYENMLGSMIIFNKDATYSTPSFAWVTNDDGTISEGDAADESVPNLGRMTVAHGHDGDFVSLFPGAYGVRTTNISGKNADQYGIILK